MSEKCHDCLLPLGKRQSHTMIECLTHQLAQKDRELEQAKRDEEDERTNCHAAELALEWCKRELEQSRQREAQALAVVARVREWAVRWYGQHDPMTPLEVELDSILSDAPKVLAVVESRVILNTAKWQGPPTDGVVVERVDAAPGTPVRVIVLGRDESEG